MTVTNIHDEWLLASVKIIYSDVLAMYSTRYLKSISPEFAFDHIVVVGEDAPQWLQVVCCCCLLLVVVDVGHDLSS